MLFFNGVCTIGGIGVRYYFTFGYEYEAAALVAFLAECLFVVVVVVLEFHLVEYGCDIVFAHTLEIGQA